MSYFECPCCGCVALSSPPYDRISAIEPNSALTPPYAPQLGIPTYEVCICCGFEFGFNDDPGASRTGQRFSEYRAWWLGVGGYDVHADDPLPEGAFCRVDFEPLD